MSIYSRCYWYTNNINAKGFKRTHTYTLPYIAQVVWVSKSQCHFNLIAIGKHSIGDFMMGWNRFGMVGMGWGPCKHVITRSLHPAEWLMEIMNICWWEKWYFPEWGERANHICRIISKPGVERGRQANTLTSNQQSKTAQEQATETYHLFQQQSEMATNIWEILLTANTILYTLYIH